MRQSHAKKELNYDIELKRNYLLTIKSAEQEQLYFQKYFLYVYIIFCRARTTFSASSHEENKLAANLSAFIDENA